MTNQELKRNVIWNAVGNITYLVSQWIVTVLVTVLGGFEDAGLLSVAMSVSAIFQTVAMFGIRNYQVSDMEGKYGDSIYVGLRALTCILSMAACVVFSLISRYFGVQLLAICLFMLFRLAESYADVLHGIAQKRGRLDVAGKSFTVKGVGLLICFLFGYVLSRDLNVALLCMTLLSVAVTVIYDLPRVRSLADFRLWDSMHSCGRLALETLPLCIYLFLYSALSMLPKLILEKQCGEVLLGAYASIFAPAMLLQAATGYLYNPFATQFAEDLQAGDRKRFCGRIRTIVLAILAIAAAVMIAAQFLGEFALVLVFGEQIRDHVYMLNPILLVNFAFSYFGFFCMIAIVQRRIKWLLASVSVGFALTLIGSWLLIPVFKANGASYALLIAIAVSLCILCFGVFNDRRKQEEVHDEQ